jgi:hypothetical protein
MSLKNQLALKIQKRLNHVNEMYERVNKVVIMCGRCHKNPTDYWTAPYCDYCSFEIYNLQCKADEERWDEYFKNEQRITCSLKSYKHKCSGICLVCNQTTCLAYCCDCC